MRTEIHGLVCAVLLFASPAWAQTAPPPIPSENALKLSEIIAKIEQRDQFRYIDEIDWADEGYYDVIYYTSDKAKVEIKIDAVTGQPRM
jgi:Peptidase propeptide and YPEB domain